MDAKLNQKQLMAEKQKKMALRVKELEEQGVQWAQWKALQEFMATEKQDALKKKSEMAQKHSIAGSAASIAEQLENLEMDELPMVKIGDARSVTYHFYYPHYECNSLILLLTC